MIKRMSATKNVQPGRASRQPTLLHCITGIFALVLACASALCIYFYVTPAHASSGNHLANTTASSGRIVFDDTETETETPSRTPTYTPTSTATSISTPTATSTSMPAPSPSATAITAPSPTPQKPSKGTALPSPTATSKQAPVSVNVGTGGLQTPVASSSSSNKQSNQTSQTTGASRGAFPAVPLTISLGSIILLGLLLKMRRGGICRSSSKVGTPKLPDQATASASRERQGGMQDATIAQRAFDLAVPWGGVLSRDQLAQALQRRSVSMVSPLPSPSDVSNATPYSETTANASFYSYPGFKRSIDPVTQAVDMNVVPTIPDIPVPATNRSALHAQTPSEPSSDNLEKGDSTVGAWIQTYIY